MKTKLVSITKPEIEGITTAEELISYCARVSNPSNQMNTETAPRLLAYLIKHKHWSPFEMANITFEIKTSRAIAAQILRHRSFSFQEFSQRYASVIGTERIEWRKQGKTNRQVGDEVVELPIELQDNLQWVQDKCEDLYHDLVNFGVAKECARMVLPLNTSTTIYMNGTVRSWIHYLDIRCINETQKEHREIAEEIKATFNLHFPNVADALGWKNS
jgi:thymidylate synthase (FAD)